MTEQLPWHKGSASYWSFAVSILCYYPVIIRRLIYSMTRSQSLLYSRGEGVMGTFTVLLLIFWTSRLFFIHWRLQTLLHSCLHSKCIVKAHCKRKTTETEELEVVSVLQDRNIMAYEENGSRG